MKTYVNKQRITQRQKDANDKQWYKDQLNRLDSHSFSNNQIFGYGGVSEYKRKKVNYDLFNNIVNIRDFEYVCHPYGANAGELPANFTNRDIISSKIKVLLGMEMSMPFSWKVVATNEEATTRKEEEEFGRMRDFVVSTIMSPIRAEAEARAREEAGGRQLTEQEKQELQKNIEAEVTAKTPDSVRKYMLRKHQDPAEVMNHQILEYLIYKERISEKFNLGWKHNLIAGEEIYCVGIVNGEPSIRVVNPLFFDYEKSHDQQKLNKSQWAVEEMRLSPAEVVAMFGDDLTEAELDEVYEYNDHPTHVYDADFTFTENDLDSPNTIRVIHGTWVSLMKLGFLTYMSRKTGKVEMMIVDENYKLNAANGDIRIEWEWVPEVHEGYKILDKIFCYCRPLPGQRKDLDNLWEYNLPYYGQLSDNINSPVTSAMDRAKSYQYYYNIICYRIELLMASDKGKILAMNIGAIPRSMGIDIPKFQYFLEANKLALFNPSEEGNKGGNSEISNLAKDLDFSLATDIAKYIDLAEYIERKCGESIGVNKNMEGYTEAREAVSNTKQNIVQSSHSVRPYFETHNSIKRDVLEGLLECAKVAYSMGRPRKLSYIMDDLSEYILTVDQDMLSNNSMGIFVANSSKAHDAKQLIENNAQAALQNQLINLSDMIKVIRSESIVEAEEVLEVAEQKKADQMKEVEQMKVQGAKELEMAKQQFEREKWAHEKYLVITKEQERRETEIQKQTIFSMGFDENKDRDEDGTPDILEVAKFGVDAQIKQRKMALDERKLDHQIQHDAEKIEVDKKKMRIQASKKTASS